MSAFSANLSVATHQSDTVCPLDLIINHIYTLNYNWCTFTAASSNHLKVPSMAIQKYSPALRDQKCLMKAQFESLFE